MEGALLFAEWSSYVAYVADVKRLSVCVFFPTVHDCSLQTRHIENGPNALASSLSFYCYLPSLLFVCLFAILHFFM